MLKDSTFEFERKRNRPERYDRNLTENTLKAIKKIDKVRVDREARHHAMRFSLYIYFIGAAHFLVVAIFLLIIVLKTGQDERKESYGKERGS